MERAPEGPAVKTDALQPGGPDGPAGFFQLDRTSGLQPDAVASILNGIANGTTDLIAAEDSSYRYTFFNEAYAREFRKLWGQELTLGTSMLDAMAPWPEEQRKARELWARALAGETFNIVQSFGPTAAESRTYDLRFSPVRDAEGRQIGAAHIFRDVTEQVKLQQELTEALAQRQLILEELDHRIKNLLTMVQAMAHQSMRRADLPEAARAAFFGRLAALSRAQEILLRNGDAPVGMRELAQTALSPFGTDAQVRLEGPMMLLPSRAAIPIAMALHELATNAVKHGALSAEGGQVDLSWSCSGEGTEPAITLAWEERGGPPPREPDRRGFGLRLVEQSLPVALGGRASIAFAPEGFRCRIEGRILATG
jgi:two-component sensor histidine kinase